MINIKQGEDIVVELIVLDEDNKKVDLSTANKIRVSFSIKNLIAYKYLDSSRETVISGYGDCSVNTTNNFQLDILVNRAQSATFPVGTIACSVLIDFPDAVLTNKRLEYNYTIGTVEKGTLRDEDLTV